jgi:hypothetical protein
MGHDKVKPLTPKQRRDLKADGFSKQYLNWFERGGTPSPRRAERMREVAGISLRRIQGLDPWKSETASTGSAA